MSDPAGKKLYEKRRSESAKTKGLYVAWSKLSAEAKQIWNDRAKQNKGFAADDKAMKEHLAKAKAAKAKAAKAKAAKEDKAE